jgi:PAS domain S-box-containing protein
MQRILNEEDGALGVGSDLCTGLAMKTQTDTRAATLAPRRFEILQALLEHSREGVALLGADGAVVYANPAITQLLGYAADEYAGNLLVSLTHPEDHQAVADIFADVLTRPGNEASGVFRWQCGDGSWRELHTTWTNQVHVPGVEAVVTHFSEVGLLSLPTQPFDLTRSRELQVLIENAVHITAILERNGTIRYMSPAVERMLGYSAPTLIGVSVSEVIHADDQPAALQCFAQKAQRAGPGQLSQFRVRHKDGSWRLLEAIITNRLDDPLIGGIVVDARDITERTWSAERLQQSLEALLAIHQVGRLLGSNPEKQAIGAALLDSARRIAPIEEAVLLLRNARGNLTCAGTSGGTAQIWASVRRARSARAARQLVLQSGLPQFFRARRSELGTSPIEAWDLPLRAQERVIGILEVYGTSLAVGPGIDELSILADQAASALERARLYQELAERERRREALVRQLLLAEDEERRRVAYEIHDGLAQLAWAAQQHLEAFAAQYHARNQQRRNELGKALNLAGRTVQEARRVIAGLRPAILDDFGLGSAIAIELQAAQRADGWETEFNDGLGSIRLDPSLETALFRVVQEALTNVRKHAHTKRVAVTLEQRANWLHLEVRDWGRGFRLAAVQAAVGPSERVGLAGMQERVALISGRLAIRSRPGAGTRIQVQAPLRELASKT